MRHDVVIDKRQVRCPNASHLGFDKIHAQVGDVVTFRYDGDGTSAVGRMIGRIQYAPPLQGDKGPIVNYLLLVVLSGDMTHTYERWINPNHVTRVQAIREQRQVTEWFLSDLMVSASVDEVRESTEQGWSTMLEFRKWKAKRDADIAELEARPMCSQCGQHHAQRSNPVCIDCVLKARALAKGGQ